jgi:spermidine synthase
MMTILLLLCVLLLPLKGHALEPAEKLLFEKNSPYQYISVIENTAKKERVVRNQKREYAQGGIHVNAPDKLLFEFTQMGFVSLAFLDREPKEVLFVGLGAGAMPRYFSRHYPEATVDIAEIDPDMVAVAQRYFYFKENEKMRVTTEDGRMFVKRTKKKYDLIVLDAYHNDYIPFHLTTLEFLKEVGSRLKENGIVVSNITSPFRNKFFDSMVATYKKTFPNLYIFKGKKSANFIFVATASSKSRDRGEIEARAARVQAARKMDIDLVEIASRFQYSADYEWGGAKVLTDDFAPVNLYQHQKSGAQ